MGGDLCGVVEKKRRREGDGGRVRECTDEDDEDKGDKTRFGGHLHTSTCTCARLAAKRRDAGNTRVQRMGAAAGNLRSVGRERARVWPAQDGDLLCFELLCVLSQGAREKQSQQEALISSVVQYCYVGIMR
jgi:hypothetical protein